MESRLLSEMKDAGRFYDFGSRTVINYDSISILIKNMPVDQPDKYGVIKDNIFALLQGADARLKALDLQETVNQEHEQQKLLVVGLNSGIQKLESDYMALTNDVAAVVDQIVDSVEHVMQTLLLTEEQEAILLGQLKHGRNNVIALFQGYASMDEQLKALIEQ